MSGRILIVDDEESIRRNLSAFFHSKGYDTIACENGSEAIELCRNEEIELVLLDLKLLDMSGLDVLEAIKRANPEIGAIMMTAYGDVETAVKVIQMKADNFVLKPVDLQSLLSLVERALKNRRLWEEMRLLKRKISQLEGDSADEKLRLPSDIRHTVRLLSKNDQTSVLILGETGTGKGLLAKTIHAISPRKEMPFIEINCAGLDTALLESELFGHEAGAFTDAKNLKKGLLEVADGGSLLLDEVGDMPLPVQAKLLKVIEDKSFRRVGGNANIKVNVRIIAATNVDLEKAAEEGALRKDLYFRLNVLPIELPPLRDRKQEILLLAQDFMLEFSQRLGKEMHGFSAEALSLMENYPWPGNIRELRNVMERATLICEESRIQTYHLPDQVAAIASVIPSSTTSSGEEMTLEALEKLHIQRIMQNCGDNQSKAAKILGIHRTTLINKLKKYQI